MTIQQHSLIDEVEALYFQGAIRFWHMRDKQVEEGEKGIIFPAREWQRSLALSHTSHFTRLGSVEAARGE